MTVVADARHVDLSQFPRPGDRIVIGQASEFGAAELKGQTLAERTRRLIAIAHPGFREELAREARTIQHRGF